MNPHMHHLATLANRKRWAHKPGDAEILDACYEYADMGYSRSEVAAIMGYSRPHFTREVLPRIDPDNSIQWPSRGWSAAHKAYWDDYKAEHGERMR